MHVEKFTSITSDFPSHLFSFPSFFFLLSTDIEEKEYKKKEKQVVMTPLATFPGLTAPHKSALSLFHLQGQRASGGSMHEPTPESRA